ncbi:carboxymuconolactone decarboxylase family protein [Pseudomonas sp. AA-38]|uniref:carboxymuconolactone decarboxylase family protein n=1 Tax=Pseudomonas sp. AA-38 TaxID=3028807 RepID=UPI0023F99C42|nr:carboxymuconolactone decarboxylase family protein [Pseudomonas sp. AA-38]
MARLNWFEASPGAARALGGLHHYVTTGTNLPPQLIHLVFLRASQINGCAHCIDIHSRDLIKGGMSVEKLMLVPVWHEAAHLFSYQERSALAWMRIPRSSGHPFHEHLTTDSTLIRPPIPRASGH